VWAGNGNIIFYTRQRHPSSPGDAGWPAGTGRRRSEVNILHFPPSAPSCWFRKRHPRPGGSPWSHPPAPALQPCSGRAVRGRLPPRNPPTTSPVPRQGRRGFACPSGQILTLRTAGRCPGPVRGFGRGCCSCRICAMLTKIAFWLPRCVLNHLPPAPDEVAADPPDAALRGCKTYISISCHHHP
jgi:hypothetical protein